MLNSLYARLGLGLAALILIGLAAFAIKSGIDKIDRQGRQIANLQRDLAAEKAARKADVAGLTILSQGVVAAASARALDDKLLAETIDAKNPQPVSPGLADFLDGLRKQRPPARGGVAGAAPRPRPVPAGGARGPGR
jgi:hypothetical protein